MPVALRLSERLKDGCVLNVGCKDVFVEVKWEGVTRPLTDELNDLEREPREEVFQDAANAKAMTLKRW